MNYKMVRVEATTSGKIYEVTDYQFVELDGFAYILVSPINWVVYPKQDVTITRYLVSDMGYLVNERE